MIHKFERANGDISVSGVIESYRDFRNCLVGCSLKETIGAKSIIREFAYKHKEKFEEYLSKAEKEYSAEQGKKRFASGEN